MGGLGQLWEVWISYGRPGGLGVLDQIGILDQLRVLNELWSLQKKHSQAVYFKSDINWSLAVPYDHGQCRVKALGLQPRG